MSEKKHNRIPGPEEFLRYRRNNLSGKEKNALEREMQNDPFSMEAEEGFSSLDSDTLENDLNALQKRLELRTGSGVKKSFIFYRAAASLAIFTGLTVLLIYISRSTGENKKTSEPGTVALNIHLSEPLTRKKEKIASETVSQVPEKKGMNLPTSPPEKTDDAPATEQNEKVNEPGLAKTTGTDITGEAKAEQPQAYMQAARVQEITDTRKAVAADAAAGGVAGKALSEKEEFPSAPPEPDTGIEEFRKYITENQRKPAGFREGNVYNVELSFNILPDGTPGKIRIISTPGKAFADEAIRLIKEGPKWKPATINGKPSDEPVKITIIFR